MLPNDISYVMPTDRPGGRKDKIFAECRRAGKRAPANQRDSGGVMEAAETLFPGHGHHRRCHNRVFRFVGTNQAALTVIGARRHG